MCYLLMPGAFVFRAFLYNWGKSVHDRETQPYKHSSRYLHIYLNLACWMFLPFNPIYSSVYLERHIIPKNRIAIIRTEVSHYGLETKRHFRVYTEFLRNKQKATLGQSGRKSCPSSFLFCYRLLTCFSARRRSGTIDNERHSFLGIRFRTIRSALVSSFYRMYWKPKQIIMLCICCFSLRLPQLFKYLLFSVLLWA